MRHIRIFLSLFLLSLTLNGCGSSQLERVSQSGATTPPLVIQSADGQFRLSIPQKALPNGITPTVSIVEGLGFTGRAYRVEPAGLLLSESATVTLRRPTAQGAFCIGARGPQGGIVPLATSSGDSDSLSASVIHFSQYGLTTPLPVSNESEARNRFVTDYQGYLGFLEDFEDSQGRVPFRGAVAGFGPFAVKAGDRFGNEFGQPRSELIVSSVTISRQNRPAREVTIPSDGWVFWVDLGDQMPFAHPSIYLHLDAVTGKINEWVFTLEPALNGENLLPGADQRQTVASRLFGAQPTQNKTAEIRGQEVTELTDCKRLAVIFKASNESYVRNTVTPLKAKLTSVNLPILERRIRNTADITKVVDEIKRFQEEECDCEGFDEVFIYLIGHGVDDPESQLGQFLYKDDNNDTIRDASGEAITTTFIDFLAEIHRICRKRPDRTTQLGETGVLNVFLEVCFAGRALNDLESARSQLTGRDAGTNRRARNLQCFRGNILAAAAVTEYAKGVAFSINPLAKRQQATLQFLQDLTVDSQGRIDMVSTFSKGLDEGFSFYPQLPDLKFFIGGIQTDTDPRDCPCCPEPDPPERPPVDLILDTDSVIVGCHEVGTSPCPQEIGFVSITNNGQETVDISIASTNPAIIVTPGVATKVAPGDSANFTVKFECGTMTSFISQLQVLALSRESERRTSLNVEVQMAIKKDGVPVTIAVDRNSVDFVHEVGVTSCPQPLGTITVQNTGSEPADISAATTNTAIDVAPALATNIPPGGQAVFNVQFNCSTNSSFNSEIQILAVGRNTNSEARATVPVQASVN